MTWTSVAKGKKQEVTCTSQIKKEVDWRLGTGLPLAWSSGARCARSRIPCVPWWCQSWGRRLCLKRACRERDDGIDDASRATTQAAGSNWMPTTPGRVEATLGQRCVDDGDCGYSRSMGLTTTTMITEAAMQGRQRQLMLKMTMPCTAMLHHRRAVSGYRGLDRDDGRCRGGESANWSCDAAATALAAMAAAGSWQHRGRDCGDAGDAGGGDGRCPWCWRWCCCCWQEMKREEHGNSSQNRHGRSGLVSVG